MQTRKSSGFKIAGGTRKLTKRYPADMERHLVHLKENEHLSHRAIVERLYPNLPFSPAKVSQVRDRYWAYTQHMAKLAANAPVHDEESGFVDGESACLSVMGVESEIGNDKESEQQLDDEQIFSWMK